MPDPTPGQLSTTAPTELTGAAERPTVAVIGSGVAGLTAAYLLQRNHRVTLFESDDRLGGHAHTHDVIDRAGMPVQVDTGFIVHNRRTYPELLRLFAELDVPTQESEMSMSVSCAGCGLEYAGAKGISGALPSVRNLTNLRYLRMLAEVTAFHRHARELLKAGDEDLTTLGEFIEQRGYSTYFVQHFLLPVVSCVWSCGTDVAAEYPAVYLFRFLDNHGMLRITGSPVWRTVTGGSRTYVERAVKQLTAVHTGVPVRAVSRHPHGVTIRTDDDDALQFDRVVIATHPDQALRLLAEPTDAERRVLGAIGYSASTTLLHSDPTLLPRLTRARASWNYRMAGCATTQSAVQVTYDMNRLQRLDTATPYLVTLNSESAVAADTVVDRMHYEHPIYTPASVAAQRELPTLASATTVFAGAYHGWGFHEDGCASGVRAAAHFGSGWDS